MPVAISLPTRLQRVLIPSASRPSRTRVHCPPLSVQPSPSSWRRHEWTPKPTAVPFWSRLPRGKDSHVSPHWARPCRFKQTLRFQDTWPVYEIRHPCGESRSAGTARNGRGLKRRGHDSWPGLEHFSILGNTSPSPDITNCFFQATKTLASSRYVVTSKCDANQASDRQHVVLLPSLGQNPVLFWSHSDRDGDFPEPTGNPADQTTPLNIIIR